MSYVKISIILRMKLEVALGMIAGRTDIRCLFADYDMTAIAAFPYLNLASGKYLCRFHVTKQRTVSFFVMFLYGSD